MCKQRRIRAMAIWKMFANVYITDADKNSRKSVYELCIQQENQWLSFVAQRPCCRLWVMPEWGYDTHVEINGCSSAWDNGVSGGLRRLRRRAYGNADSAGCARFGGYTGCAAYSGTYACANPRVDACAYADAHAGTHTRADTDGDAETHAYFNSCAYADGDTGTNARTHGGEHRFRRRRAYAIHGLGIRPALTEHI